MVDLSGRRRSAAAGGGQRLKERPTAVGALAWPTAVGGGWRQPAMEKERLLAEQPLDGGLAGRRRSAAAASGQPSRSGCWLNDRWMVEFGGRWRSAAAGGCQRSKERLLTKQPLDGGCAWPAAVGGGWQRSAVKERLLAKRPLEGGFEWPVAAGEVNIEYMSAARSMFHANLTDGQVSWCRSPQALRNAQVLVQSWSC